MEIRRLSEQDALLWQALRLTGLKHTPTAFGSSYAEESTKTPESLQERFRTTLSTPTNAVFGAFNDAALVGCIGIFSDGRPKTAHRMKIWGLYVDAVARNQGVGRQLMIAATEFARGIPDIIRVELTVESGNYSAIDLYQSLGFNRWGVDPQSLKIDGVFYDEDHMSLVL